MRNGVGSVHRAIDILTAFTRKESELSLASIAAKTGLPKPTVFRLLATLRARDLVLQDPDSGLYSLGFGVLALATVRTQQTDVRAVALPVLRRIRDAIEETTVLSVRVGEYRVHVEQVESRLPIRRTVELGERVPLYVGAASKILLAGLSDDETQAYVSHTELRPYSPTTTTEPTQLLQELSAIRARGYAEGLNERNVGGVGVAAPIRDYSGRVVAAVHVSLPQFRYSKELRHRCIEAVIQGARAISERLGFTPHQ